MLVAIGCQRSASPAIQASPAIVAAPSTAAAPCIASGHEPQGRAEDVDGDRTPDLIVTGYRDVTIYLRQGDCFTRLDTIDPEGPIAFVEVIERKGAGVRELAIDTWLFHGDRRRAHWSWDGRAYRKSGVDEEIPGPRRDHHP